MMHAAGLPLLQYGRQAVLAEALRRAWEAPDTFACIPAKTGLEPAAIEVALSALPEDLRREHFVMLTSGSTGEPKFIVGSRQRANALASRLHASQNSEGVREAIVALPLSYTYAFVNQFVWSRHHDRRLVVTEGLAEPDALGDALRRADDAMLCLVGAQIPLLQRYWPDAVFPGVVRLHFAGGRFPQDAMSALARLFPNAEVYNNYGCAEAMPRLTVRRAAVATEGAFLGMPLPGVALRTDANGELSFNSIYQARAVVRAGQCLRIADDDWTPTGDLAEAVDGGWRLVGRANEVFKRYGEKVSLPQLNDAVREVWQGESALFHRPSAGEPEHVLALAPHPNAHQLQAVLQVFRSRFKRAQWPLAIVSLDELPRGATGKADTLALARSADLNVLWKQRT